VELPRTGDLAVILRTAQTLDIEVASSILVRADRVVD